MLGVEGWLDPTLQFTVEGYKKTFANLVTPNRAQDLRREGDEFIPATGDAWGFDVLLRRHLGTVKGWIAYSFTMAKRETQDVTYPPAHDRRHTLNAVLQAPGPLGSGRAGETRERGDGEQGSHSWSRLGRPAYSARRAAISRSASPVGIMAGKKPTVRLALSKYTGATGRPAACAM